jgi:predicted amidohydrolase
MITGRSRCKGTPPPISRPWSRRTESAKRAGSSVPRPSGAVHSSLARLGIVAKASADREEVITAEFDTEELREMRANWGVFRDRRPDLYWPLMTLDGTTPHQANRAAPIPR